MRKIISIIAAVALAAAMWQCSTPAPDYDAEACRRLATAIEKRDSITPDMYAEMIGQDQAILVYLVGRAEQLADLPDSLRYGAYRAMVAEPEYLERFGYLFTLGSALYQAQLDGRLKGRNLKRYEALDRYNEQLASFADY